MLKILLLYALFYSGNSLSDSIDNPFLEFKLGYTPQLNIFLTADPEKINASIYLFTNNDPGNFIDRDGQAPIQIAQSVSLENSDKLKAHVQALTDDVVKLNQYGQSKELVLYKTSEDKISRLAGTGLVRSIIENPHNRNIVLDYNNSSGIMTKKAQEQLRVKWEETTNTCHSIANIRMKHSN